LLFHDFNGQFVDYLSGYSVYQPDQGYVNGDVQDVVPLDVAFFLMEIFQISPGFAKQIKPLVGGVAGYLCRGAQDTDHERDMEQDLLHFPVIYEIL
jgi:hypothetical protein